MRRETTLEEYVRRLGEKSLWRALRKVYEKVESGELRLVDPKPPKTLVEFAMRLDYSLWFWTTTALVFLTLVVVYTTSAVPQLTVLRYILGTLYVLYLPGYALVEALYPERGDIKPLERLALSIGLSLAVVPLIGLVLNYTPWGIRLGPVIASLALFTLGISVVALVRKYKAQKLA
jgi:Predicted membrane protein